MVELLEAEPDEAMSTELLGEAERLGKSVESFELQTMLQGPDDTRDAILNMSRASWLEQLKDYPPRAHRHCYYTSVHDRHAC